jgi:hypothetical protein
MENRGVAQPGRALRLGRSGRPFESARPDLAPERRSHASTLVLACKTFGILCAIVVSAEKSHARMANAWRDARRRVYPRAVPGFLTAEDFDDAVGEAFDELPPWVLDLLGDVVVRVEPRPRLPVRGPARWRLLLYREPILQRACTTDELRRLVRVELLRTVLAHLEVEAPQHAAPLAAMYN